MREGAAICEGGDLIGGGMDSDGDSDGDVSDSDSDEGLDDGGYEAKGDVSDVLQGGAFCDQQKMSGQGISLHLRHVHPVHLAHAVHAHIQKYGGSFPDAIESKKLWARVRATCPAVRDRGAGGVAGGAGGISGGTLTAEPAVHEEVEECKTYIPMERARKRMPPHPSSSTSRRAALVQKVMSEHSMSLTAASSYIKEQGLTW
jgi:hypothetical protein